MNCLSDVERKASALHGWDRVLAELQVPELGSDVAENGIKSQQYNYQFRRCVITTLIS